MAGIDTLIKLHRRELDALRRDLVRKEEEREQLIQLAARLHEELMRERELAVEDPITSAQYLAGFEKRIQKRQLDIAKEVIRIDGELLQLSAAIAERFGELKKYEITRENRLAREKAEEDSRDQKMMDELGLQQFTRRNEDKKS